MQQCIIKQIKQDTSFLKKNFFEEFVDLYTLNWLFYKAWFLE